MANGLGNKCAKHFCKRTLLVQLINKKHGHIFFGTRVQKRCFEKSSSPKKLFGIFSFWLRFDHVSLFEWNFADLLPFIGLSTHIYHFLKIYLNISSNGVNFYRAMRMHGTDCAVARCLSVCPSVRHTPVLCLNGYTYPQNSFTIGYPNNSSFLTRKGVAKFRRDPWTGASNARGMKRSRFSTNISLYLANDARLSHSYYRRRIGNPPKLSNATGLNDLQWPLTQISRSRYYSKSNNSKTVQDRAIFTMNQ